MPTAEPSDVELVTRANRGDASAFDSLYARHRDWVVALAFRFTGSEADAVDVLQETFAYWWRKFPGFTLTASVRGFLFPVVRHTAFSLLRKRRRVVPLEEGRALLEQKLAWHPAPTSDLERMVETLAEGHRQVVLLRFGMEMRLEEIAQALSIPLGTVKSRLHNALKILRDQLDSGRGRSG